MRLLVLTVTAALVNFITLALFLPLSLAIIVTLAPVLWVFPATWVTGELMSNLPRDRAKPKGSAT